MRPETAIPALLYHSICPAGQLPRDRWQVRAADFAADMESVARSGRVPIHARTYASWLRAGDGRLADAALVTFDDGFADFAELAFPILRRLDIASTLFVTTGWLGRAGMLSATTVRDLAEAGVEVGAHSVSHRHLDLLADSEVEHELAGSRRTLEEITGRPVTSFAYPHGSHRARTKRMVACCGYTTAHAVKNAISHPADDPFAVARFTVDARCTRERVRAVIDGRGAPRSWPGERVRTRAFRVVRAVRQGRAS
jgi:peptidoglycan/xylan/chitin deacetylase (PgdA/CDA1 family)